MRGKINTMNGPVENWQCYNCGYPVKQTTSGMAGFSTPGSTNGKATPALQIPTGGFNPQGIIGHINSL
jgi:transcription elongation factor